MKTDKKTFVLLGKERHWCPTADRIISKAEHFLEGMIVVFGVTLALMLLWLFLAAMVVSLS